MGSFRPGKASWGLTILEAESPILGMGKRLRKSWRAVLVAESMDGPLAKGPPGGRERRRRCGVCGWRGAAGAACTGRGAGAHSPLPRKGGVCGTPRGETPGTARGCGAPRRGTPGPRGALEPRGEEPGSPGCTRRALRPCAPASGHSGAGRRARGDREPVAGVPPAECAAQRAVQRERGRERTGARTRPGCSRLLRKGLRGRRALHLEPPVAGGFAQKENAVTGVKRKLNLQEADLPRPSGSPVAGVASFPPRARVPSWASRRSRGGGFRRAGYTWGAVLRGSPACQGPGLIVLPHPNS